MTSPAIKLAATIFFFFALTAQSFAQEPLNHKKADGKDDDVQDQIVSWQKNHLAKLLEASEIKGTVPLRVPSNEEIPEWAKKMKDLERKVDASKDIDRRSCYWLGISRLTGSIYIDSDPPFGTLTTESRDALSDLGVMDKQVIGDDTTYKPSRDMIARILKNAPKTRCGIDARVKQLSLGGETEDDCRVQTFQNVIDQGLALLKEKQLGNEARILIYSYLAQAYQTQWTLAFTSDGSTDIADYTPVHGQAKNNAVKYYRLLAAAAPDLKEAVNYLIGRMDAHVQLRAFFTCSQSE